MTDWLPVVGYEGLYEVSNEGQVRNAKGRALRPDRSSAYPSVRLSRSGRKTHFTLHSLVIKAFRGPRPEGMECRHIDGDPLNNHLTNLVWGTSAENSQDMIDHGHTNARITHCPQNHEYTPENTHIYDGRRYCKACNRVYSREHKRRVRAQERIT